MDWKKIILAGILFAIIAQVIHTIESILTMSYYTMPEFFTVWSKIMMPTAGPPPMSFFYYSIGFGILVGIIYAAVYELIKKGVPAKGFGKGIHYGVLLYLIAGVPFTSTIFLLVNLPVGLLVAWNISTFIIDVLGGIAFQKIMG